MKFIKTSVILLSSFILSCNGVNNFQTDFSPKNIVQNKIGMEGKINLKINLAEIFRTEKFRVKALYQTGIIPKKLKAVVTGHDMTSSVTQTVDYPSGQIATFSLPVPSGKNRIVTIYILDQNDSVTGQLMTALDVSIGNNTANITLFDNIVAQILYNLPSSSAGQVNLSELRTWLSDITGYQPPAQNMSQGGTNGTGNMTGTVGGEATGGTFSLTEPSRIDIPGISEYISNNGGSFPVVLPSGNGNLRIYSDISGVKVKITDPLSSETVTALSVQEFTVSPGKWIVTLSKSGYSDISAEVQVKANITTDLTMNFGEPENYPRITDIIVNGKIITDPGDRTLGSSPPVSTTIAPINVYPLYNRNETEVQVFFNKPINRSSFESSFMITSQKLSHLNDASISLNSNQKLFKFTWSPDDKSVVITFAGLTHSSDILSGEKFKYKIEFMFPFFDKNNISSAIGKYFKFRDSTGLDYVLFSYEGGTYSFSSSDFRLREISAFDGGIVKNDTIYITFSENLSNAMGNYFVYPNSNKDKITSPSGNTYSVFGNNGKATILLGKTGFPYTGKLEPVKIDFSQFSTFEDTIKITLEPDAISPGDQVYVSLGDNINTTKPGSVNPLVTNVETDTDAYPGGFFEWKSPSGSSLGKEGLPVLNYYSVWGSRGWIHSDYNSGMKFYFDTELSQLSQGIPIVASSYISANHATTVASSPLFSPNYGYTILPPMLLCSDHEGTSQIYIREPAKSNSFVKLTSQGKNRNASWSHDYSKIVFVSARNGSEEIFIMDSDGLNQKKVVGNIFSNSLTGSKPALTTPKFSPDGNKILFNDNSGNLYTINTDSSNLRGIFNAVRTTSGSIFYAVNWTPDEKIIYQEVTGDISGGTATTAKLYTINTDGTGKTLINNMSHSALAFPNIEWSTRGGNFLFIDDVTQDSSLSGYGWNQTSSNNDLYYTTQIPGTDAFTWASWSKRNIYFIHNGDNMIKKLTVLDGRIPSSNNIEDFLLLPPQPYGSTFKRTISVSAY